MSNIKKLRKGNRVITIPESQVKSYLQRGYDEIDESGQVLTHATGGKSVPLAEYNKIVAELEKLKSAGTGVNAGEVEEKLKEAENRIGELEEEVKVLEKENERLDGLLKKAQNNRQHNNRQ